MCLHFTYHVMYVLETCSKLLIIIIIILIILIMHGYSLGQNQDIIFISHTK